MRAEARVGFIVRGVVEQAMRDSGLRGLRLVGEPSEQTALIEEWCGYSFVEEAEALAVSGLNKTQVLLNGPIEFADLTPLGDLYASELSHLGCRPVLTGIAAEIASAAGSVEAVDLCLRKLLDERYDADAAFAGMPNLKPVVLQRLDQARFRLVRAGIVPKIGARTIGIDLFI